MPRQPAETGRPAVAAGFADCGTADLMEPGAELARLVRPPTQSRSPLGSQTLAALGQGAMSDYKVKIAAAQTGDLSQQKGTAESAAPFLRRKAHRDVTENTGAHLPEDPASWGAALWLERGAVSFGAPLGPERVSPWWGVMVT